MLGLAGGSLDEPTRRGGGTALRPACAGGPGTAHDPPVGQEPDVRRCDLAQGPERSSPPSRATPRRSTRSPFTTSTWEPTSTRMASTPTWWPYRRSRRASAGLTRSATGSGSGPFPARAPDRVAGPVRFVPYIDLPPCGVVQDLWLHASRCGDPAIFGPAFPTGDHTSLGLHPHRRPSNGSIAYLDHGTETCLVLHGREGSTEWQGADMRTTRQRPLMTRRVEA